MIEKSCYECRHYFRERAGPHELVAHCELKQRDFLNAEHCGLYQPEPESTDVREGVKTGEFGALRHYQLQNHCLDCCTSKIANFEGETQARFSLGDRVRKVGGSYQAVGTIKATFLADDGSPRYVFRFDAPAGLLHIFGEKQLAPLDDGARGFRILEYLETMKTELDFDMIKRLYEFGGLMIYRVEYFNNLNFSVIKSIATFNEDFAKQEVERLREYGFSAGIREELIKFDGAFALEKKVV